MSFSSKYILRQLNSVFPDDYSAEELIENEFSAVLAEMGHCVDRVRAWKADGFNYLNSGQYATFLYKLARRIFERHGDRAVPERLFLLNKSLNGIDLYFEIKFPDLFLVGHTVGMVFAKATYGKYLVFHQSCTVGRKHASSPVLEDGVVMFPGSMVIGQSYVRKNSVLAPGVCLVDTDTPGDCYVLAGPKGTVIFKPLDRFYAEEYFVLV